MSLRPHGVAGRRRTGRPGPPHPKAERLIRHAAWCSTTLWSVPGFSRWSPGRCAWFPSASARAGTRRISRPSPLCSSGRARGRTCGASQGGRSGGVRARGRGSERVPRGRGGSANLPGVTAASAAAASLGKSLTLRGHARRLTFVTAHTMVGAALDLDWQALAIPAPRSRSIWAKPRRANSPQVCWPRACRRRRPWLWWKMPACPPNASFSPARSPAHRSAHCARRRPGNFAGGRGSGGKPEGDARRRIGTSACEGHYRANATALLIPGTELRTGRFTLRSGNPKSMVRRTTPHR